MDEATDNSQLHAEPKNGTQSAPHEEPKTEAKSDAKHEQNMVMAILAYIGPLILVSYLLAKDDPFVKFHIKQGLLLVIGEIATWMLAMMFWPLWPLAQIVNIFLLVLAVVGIIRAVNGEQRELPLIGHWARNFHF